MDITISEEVAQDILALCDMLVSVSPFGPESVTEDKATFVASELREAMEHGGTDWAVCVRTVLPSRMPHVIAALRDHPAFLAERAKYGMLELIPIMDARDLLLLEGAVLALDLTYYVALSFANDLRNAGAKVTVRRL